LKPLLNKYHLKDLVNEEIINNEEKLVDVKKQQYLVGDIFSNGRKAKYSKKSRVAEGSTELYRDFKNRLNPKAGLGNVDLILSGSFINSFFLEEKGNGYIFKATDSKADDLLERYGEDIFDLNNKAFNDFMIKYVKKPFTLALKKQLGQ
jgi:hypothetical protein